MYQECFVFQIHPTRVYIVFGRVLPSQPPKAFTLRTPAEQVRKPDGDLWVIGGGALLGMQAYFLIHRCAKWHGSAAVCGAVLESGQWDRAIHRPRSSCRPRVGMRFIPHSLEGSKRTW